MIKREGTFSYGNSLSKLKKRRNFHMRKVWLFQNRLKKRLDAVKSLFWDKLPKNNSNNNWRLRATSMPHHQWGLSLRKVCDQESMLLIQQFWMKNPCSKTIHPKTLPIRLQNLQVDLFCVKKYTYHFAVIAPRRRCFSKTWRFSSVKGKT